MYVELTFSSFYSLFYFFEMKVLGLLLSSLVLFKASTVQAFVVTSPSNKNKKLSQHTIMSANKDNPETALSSESLQKVLNVAIDASKKAGDIILGNAGGAEVTKSKANSRDLLTLIDPLCEKVSIYYYIIL